MEITTKFNFGDKVQQIWFDYEREWVPCAFCGGEGVIIGLDKKQKDCPECYGRQGNTINKTQKWRVQKELTIGEIRVEKRCNYFPEGISDFDNYGPQVKSTKEKYMCYETGISTGTIHDVKTLFATIEEAQAECDRLNATDLE